MILVTIYPPHIVAFMIQSGCANMNAETRLPKKNSQAKRKKFRELAESRTNKALIAIARIGNLSNRQHYEFEDAEVRKVTKALREAISEVENQFASLKVKDDSRFKL
jgi:hypothetical protein